MKIHENSCRVCLVNTESSESNENDAKWFSLEEKEIEDDLTICDKITICTGVIIDQKNCLAKRICKPCTESLRSAFNFRKNCISSDNVLKRLIIDHSTIESNVQKIESYDSNIDNKDLANIYPEIKVELNCNSPIVSEESLGFLQNEENSSDSSSDKSEYESQINQINNKVSKQIVEETNSENVTTKQSTESLTTRRIPIRRRRNKLSFLCELCGNVYRKKSTLLGHKRWHTGQKEFQCEICAKSFLLATYLSKHMKIHNPPGTKNFQCSFCSLTFLTIGLQRSHETERHPNGGERVYPCKLCNRIFPYQQSLKRHMMVHSGVRPYKCCDCGTDFRQEGHLKKHLRTLVHQKQVKAIIEKAILEKSKASK